MLRVPTALLLHTTPDGRHYDWLVGTAEYGVDPQARLWTARVAHPSEAWRGLGCFDLAVIAPHRRVYLDYQGLVSGGRGGVTRLDRGEAVIELWRAGRIVCDIQMKHFRGRVLADVVDGDTWRARVIG